MQQTFETWATTQKMAERRLEVFVNMLQDVAGGPQGYRLRRILLTNFWLYGQQEFEIPHGRLFLAGENASGKSTVLTAALPLALDGDLRPNRIDTFGGRERHIDYYVLGGTESATPFRYERRTAYIALEFEWCDPNTPPIAPEMRQQWENANAEQRAKLRFLTIGLSLAGNANVSDRIRPLRFLITDGSRLGYDLHTVYDTDNKQEKRAYDHVHFKQILEGHGILCESQAEYERQVGRHLFGFTDVKDFQKLINLLLVLRRPNLSTELNFSRVHEYLKQSLRKISSETTHRVIGTIERIDAIQSEIERIQEAYDSTARLHQAVQHLVLTRVQLTGNEYVDAQQAEDAIQSRATKLRRDVTTADNERKKADTRSQALQAQLSQISGQTRALENSEGLQLAKQLETTRERTHESEAQLHLQEQSLASARQALDALSDTLQNKQERFTRTKTELTTQLDELRTLATNECYWDLAAFQLEEALRSTTAASTDTQSTPRMPQAVSLLVGEQAQERISWLRSLEALHQQREKADDRLQNARSLETTRFQELDEARRRFQTIQDSIYETRQKLNEVLERWIAADNRLFSSETLESSLALIALDEGTPSVEDIQEEGFHTTKVVSTIVSAFTGYRQIIEILERELLDATDQVQGELNELQLLTGSKSQQLSTLQEENERKRAEPEYVPPRPGRHTLARTKLAEQSIAAFPLYMLLDFVPNLDSKEAGRIEFMLEDAGLLDALVVAPTQIAVADTILASEGLSDCRLNTDLMHSTSQPPEIEFQRWLRFDEAFKNDVQETINVEWQTITTTILTALSQRQVLATTNFSLSENGAWTHGLLTGQASSGEALCIGKATRLRVKQRELDALEAQCIRLEGELQWFHARLAEFEQQLAQLQEQQGQVRRLLPASGMEEQYAQLAQAKIALDDGNGKYQKARQLTQEMRQLYTSFAVQLERESQGIGPLATSTKQVQRALEGTINLSTQARTVQLQFSTLIRTWNDYQKDKTSLETARGNEATSMELYERVRQQALQTRAEFQELQHIAEETDVEGLGERLRGLREQNEDFSKQLEDAKASFIRADERANNAQVQLTETETQVQLAHNESVEKQARFTQVLIAYPVEQLVEVRQLVTDDENKGLIRAAKKVIAELLREENDNPLSHKERLDTAYRDAYSALSKVFNREQAFLLEYGPDLDDQGHVRFLNENKSRPIELLELLSERIEMQRTLLGQEERQLFEDFLLQEIAEAIRTHILEAEEWVQQINTVLSGLPMIGEHYSLQWKPLAEFDPSMLGGHLAQQYKLLRKPVQTLTTEESETLMAAFRQEIESVRIRQQETPDMNFMDALEQVFDYREWFHFDVWVTHAGQRQRLTDRVAGTRSGAEQLFALYVPLFAALGALYRVAAPGAPRLLALDEAFDKVSVANTQRIMEFLVSQDFQWIMTGPQVSGTGAKIPASARYLMLHEKGSSLATASASFWSDSQDIQNGHK